MYKSSVDYFLFLLFCFGFYPVDGGIQAQMHHSQNLGFNHSKLYGFSEDRVSLRWRVLRTRKKIKSFQYKYGKSRTKVECVCVCVRLLLLSQQIILKTNFSQSEAPREPNRCTCMEDNERHVIQNVFRCSVVVLLCFCV